VSVYYYTRPAFQRRVPLLLIRSALATCVDCRILDCFPDGRWGAAAGQCGYSGLADIRVLVQGVFLVAGILTLGFCLGRDPGMIAGQQRNMSAWRFGAGGYGLLSSVLGRIQICKKI